MLFLVITEPDKHTQSVLPMVRYMVICEWSRDTRIWKKYILATPLRLARVTEAREFLDVHYMYCDLYVTCSADWSGP